MKIKIESDVFDIVNRIKEIDENYFVLYDDVRKSFEIHNCNQFDSYCFTSKYKSLDSRIIDEINVLNIINIDNIIEEIDNNNANIERNNMDKTKNVSDYMIREIYNYCANSSKELNSNVAFSTKWR